MVQDGSRQGIYHQCKDKEDIYNSLLYSQDFPEVSIRSFDRDSAPEVLVDADGEHAKIVREMGAAAAVVLSNDGVLPLSDDLKKIAIVGSDAGPIPM